MQINFSKYEGAGNDFVAIDMMSTERRLTCSQLRRMCDRKMGVGADGVLSLEKSERPGCAYKLVYYNSDGQVGSLCGNGSRCSLAFAERLRLIDLAIEAEAAGTQATVKSARTQGLEKTVFFEAFDGLHKGGKTLMRAYRPIQEASSYCRPLYFVDIKDVQVSDIRQLSEVDYFLDTGSPHHVRFVKGNSDEGDDVRDMKEALDHLDVFTLGKNLRWSLYGPEGANINFVTEEWNPTNRQILDEEQKKEDKEENDDEEDNKDIMGNDLKYDIEGKDVSPKEDDPNRMPITRTLAAQYVAPLAAQSESPKSYRQRLYVRTFERGVEDETLACGTGATASALVAYLRHRNCGKGPQSRSLTSEEPINESEAVIPLCHDDDAESEDINLAHRLNAFHQTPLLRAGDPKAGATVQSVRMTVLVKGGELEVSFDFDGRTFSDIKLYGGAKHVFDGSITV